MSTPVSGNGINISLTPGKVAFWSVTAQAQLNQYVALKDSSGGEVFHATGSGGTGGTPQQIGSGTFKVNTNGNYTLYIGTNGGKTWSQVLWGDLPLNYRGTIYLDTLTFISEDSGDIDFNDSVLTISTFNSLG